VQYISETGNTIQQVYDASYLTGMQEAIAPYRQLYVFQIIRYWAELSQGLQYPAMKLGKEDIPFLSEIFANFCISDADMRMIKDWNTI
jgi:hypothetical protein